MALPDPDRFKLWYKGLSLPQACLHLVQLQSLASHVKPPPLPGSFTNRRDRQWYEARTPWLLCRPLLNKTNQPITLLLYSHAFFQLFIIADTLLNCTVRSTKLSTPLHTICLINDVVKNRSGGSISNTVLQANALSHGPRALPHSPINLTYTSHPSPDWALL